MVRRVINEDSSFFHNEFLTLHWHASLDDSLSFTVRSFFSQNLSVRLPMAVKPAIGMKPIW